jgi:hypothetical protein
VEAVLKLATWHKHVVVRMTRRNMGRVDERNFAHTHELLLTSYFDKKFIEKNKKYQK